MDISNPKHFKHFNQVNRVHDQTSNETLVSIIIPVKAINDYLRQETIPAILVQSYKNFEVIVVPDKKTKEEFPQTKIIPSWPKTGPADKRDLGVKNAKGEILAFLDDDSYPDKNWLKNAFQVFNIKHQTSPDVMSGRSSFKRSIAAVCGPTLTPPHNNLRQKASGYVWSTWLGSGGAGTYRGVVYPRREVDDFPSVNFLVRKKDFLNVGGFDSHFWPGEDSLAPDEEVLIVDQSNNIERIKIGDLVDSQLKNFITFKDKKSEISYKNINNLSIFAFDNNYQIKKTLIKAFIRHKKFHKFYELNLSRGNRIKLTDSHSLFTFNNENGEIIPIKVNQLKPGNLIITPRKITISKDIKEINNIKLLLSLENRFIYDKKSVVYLRDKKYITYLSKKYKKDILEAVNKYSLKGNINNWKYCGCLPLIVLKNLPSESYELKLIKKFDIKLSARGHNHVVRMNSVISLDEDFLWFLGFFYAEGWLSNSDKIKKENKWSLNLSQRARNSLVLERARDILQSHLGPSFSLHKDKRNDVLFIGTNCRVLWCFLRALGLQGLSYEKRISSFIFTLPNKKIRAFLDGYHAGDCCDYADGRIGKLGITTSSPEMTKDFALLFLRLGETFRITRHKEERKAYYHDQFNINTFCSSIDKLGLDPKLMMLKNLQDGLPAINFLLKIAKKYHLTSKLIANGIALQYLNRRDNRKKVTWKHTNDFLKVLKKIAGNIPEIENLEKIINSDLRFEEVLEINEVKNQPQYAYDLSIGGEPNLDNFIAGNFVCVHNTKLCHDLVYKLGKKIIYDPKVLVYHHRRPVFKSHLIQISRYAIHRGHFTRILPKTSLRLGYLMPSFFVLWLFGGPVLIFLLEIFQLCAVSIPLFFLYLLTIGLYLVLLLITSFQVYLKEKNLKLALLIIPSIFITHIVYGILFIKGFFSPRLKR